VQKNARTTLALESPQSPRRPAIDPWSDERLTQQRRQEEELLQAIESAMKCNDDARVEELRPQLKGLQQQGVELRKSVASKERANKLQECRRKIAEAVEATRSLAIELRAAEEFLRALEARVDESAVRTKNLEKELDTLLAEARPET
jgi:chromosome segregation ATPase